MDVQLAVIMTLGGGGGTLLSGLRVVLSEKVITLSSPQELTALWIELIHTRGYGNDSRNDYIHKGAQQAFISLHL